MDSRMTWFVAREHLNDLQREATRQRAATDTDERVEPTTIALRFAGEDEDEDLRALAEHTSTTPLSGNALVAIADGRIVAALGLDDGRIVARHPGAESAIGLLQLRAIHLGVTRPPRWRALRFARRVKPRVV